MPDRREDMQNPAGAGSSSFENALKYSVEQSLSYERMQKYTVFHNRHEPREEKAVRPAVGSRQRTGVSRQSTAQDLLSPSDVRQDSSSEVRLAVTTDHCVWYVNPYTGQTEILAGHPKLSGYCDDVDGLTARFSSPKGLVNIGSVLLVADYWNNVIRCINLYTTQVDTIVDFAPQGPVAICISDSGMIYALDSDHIHYANMLQIRSMPVREEPLYTNNEDHNSYESLFTPTGQRSRQSSV